MRCVGWEMELSELICQISILVGTIEGLIGTQRDPACVLEMGGIGRICRGRSCRCVDYGLSVCVVARDVLA